MIHEDNLQALGYGLSHPVSSQNSIPKFVKFFHSKEPFQCRHRFIERESRRQRTNWVDIDRFLDRMRVLALLNTATQFSFGSLSALANYCISVTARMKKKTAPVPLSLCRCGMGPDTLGLCRQPSDQGSAHVAANRYLWLLLLTQDWSLIFIFILTLFKWRAEWP